MNKSSLTFLENLLNAPSPSGYEGPARKIWLNSLKKVADSLTVDVHGNSIATINPQGSPHIMLAGHIDELGFQICHIESSGLLRFRQIGGHDLRLLEGRRVIIHAEKESVIGVIGKKPIHLIAERNKSLPPPKIQDMWIDAGFSSKKEAEKLITIGDPATYIDDYIPLRNKLSVARGFDNKVGAFVVAEVIQRLSKLKKAFSPKVSAVATVQEEIGLRGAQTSAFGLNADIGIAVDVTWATDNPGGDAREIGEVKLGGGPVIVRGPNANPKLYEIFRQAAKTKKIPYQLRALPRAAGNDANAMQISRAGMAAGVVGIPLRYMHTPVEVGHLGDLDHAISLIVATIAKINKRTSFIPQ